MNLYDSVNNVLKRLDDYPDVGSEAVWTRDEIELYLQDGYDAFCRQTKCLWDMFYPENIPQAGNYVGRWELDYFESGQIKVGLLNFSGGFWEGDYAEAGAIGPRNSTQPWESTYVENDLDQVFAVSLLEVPEDSVTVDRATYNMQKLEPEYTAWFQEQDRSFQTTEGTPSRFAMDKDGMSWMRIIPAGNGNATTYDVSGTYGLLRDAEDTDGLGTWSPMGSWGVLREIPEHFPMGGQYGIPRRLFSDTANTRVEYFRTGNLLEEYPYELPERFAKYVEFYAMAKTLERDGPGQDIKLAGHFMERFSEGVRRMVVRLSENRRSRISKIGSTGKLPTRPGLARLPWQYGRATRRGY